MPYVKLDCGILDSTVWTDRDTCTLFITALLMAAPREFAEPIKTFEVDANEPTGWDAPAGWYGFIEAAGPGIIRRAMMDLKSGLVALRALCSPDPESRTPKNEGRRLARVKGGYLVLNYMDYREKDHTAAERARRYRERKFNKTNGRDVTDETRDGVTVTRNVTQAEAEAEADLRIRIKNPVDNGDNGDNSDAAQQRTDVRHKALGSPDAKTKARKEVEADNAWLLLITSDGKIRPPEVQAAIDRIPGGWKAIKLRTPKTEPGLRSQFIAAMGNA